MEKEWLFVLGTAIIVLITIIGLVSISANTTGAVIYGKCWDLNQPMADRSKDVVRMQGCIVENTRVCCPFESCPDIEELSCS